MRTFKIVSLLVLAALILLGVRWWRYAGSTTPSRCSPADCRYPGDCRSQADYSPTDRCAPTAKPAPVKLKVWVEMSDNPKLFQDEFAKYAKANNVEVEVVCPAPMDKILAALSGSDAPDVIAMSGSTLAQSLAYQGLTLDLKELGTVGGIDFNDIFPSSLVVCQQGSKLACLPWGTDTNALYWNKDLFEEAGLDPEKPPKTLDELNQYAEKLTKKDAKGNYTQMGFIPAFPWSQQGTINYLFGGSNYADGGHTLTVNSQGNIDSYKWAQSFYKKYGATKVIDFQSGFGDYASSENGFFAGKVAMAVDGEWVVGPNFIPKFAPELNYGVAPIPVAANQAGQVRQRDGRRNHRGGAGQHQEQASHRQDAGVDGIAASRGRDHVPVCELAQQQKGRSRPALQDDQEFPGVH